MKRLVILALLVPSIAMAGVVMVDEPATSKAAPAVPASVEAALASVAPTQQAPVVVGGPISSAAQIVPAPEQPKTWKAPAGSTLRESIQKWADEAQWHLVWNAPDGPDKQVNYPIVLPLAFQGPVEQAVADCISLYEKARKPLAVLIQPEQRAFIVQLKNN